MLTPELRKRVGFNKISIAAVTQQILEICEPRKKIKGTRNSWMLARLAEDGEYRVYAVTRDGAALQQRNWPRLWHEGNLRVHGRQP
jgi:hypothetical protein